jgi:DNA modification methylase
LCKINEGDIVGILSSKVFVGDCREKLNCIGDESIHCCITSPPYFNLRDYHHVNQIGQETELEKYIDELVEVFSLVKKKLHASGTCWINLGDSYAGKSMDGGCIKPKDLMGVPWRVAFALQKDGWYLRDCIIWAKGVSFCPTYDGSCLPEPVEDRCSRSYEYVFLFAKSRQYFYNIDAAREKTKTLAHHQKYHVKKSRKKLDDGRNSKAVSDNYQKGLTDSKTGGCNPKGRNLRNVWTINPMQYKGNHYATMPEALAEPCVKLGTSVAGCCGNCKLPIVGNERQCGCANNVVEKCVVLDPFCGTGTVGVVANNLNCNFVGIEINSDFANISCNRIKDAMGLYVSVEKV